MSLQVDSEIVSRELMDTAPAKVLSEKGTQEIPRIQGPNGNATNSPSSTTQGRVKYRHVAAVHSRSRKSCLSSDSDQSPSFLGFRNLMVIVLSKLLVPDIFPLFLGICTFEHMRYAASAHVSMGRSYSDSIRLVYDG